MGEYGVLFQYFHVSAFSLLPFNVSMSTFDMSNSICGDGRKGEKVMNRESISGLYNGRQFRGWRALIIELLIGIYLHKSTLSGFSGVSFRFKRAACCARIIFSEF